MKDIDRILKDVEKAYKTAEGREVVGCALPILLVNGEKSYCVYLEPDPYNLSKEKVVQTFDEGLFFERGELLSGLKQTMTERLDDVHSGLKGKRNKAKDDAVLSGTIASVFGGMGLVIGLLYPPMWIPLLVAYGTLTGGFGAFGICDYKNKGRMERAMKKVNKLREDWEKEVNFVSEASEELKHLAEVVYEEKRFGGCSSPVVYRGIRELVKGENDKIDPKCISKYTEIKKYFEMVKPSWECLYPIGGATLVYPSAPKVSFTAIGIDFIKLYKNSPEDFKVMFSKIGEKKRREVLKEISSLKERSEEVDEWLSEKYSIMSKEAAMDVI